MKKIIKRLVDNYNDKYIVVKDLENNEYYLLIEYRADYSNCRKDDFKIGYRVEVKGLKI